MKIIRFVLPFLFVRNWHTGAWELSQSRCVFFGSVLLALIGGLVIAYFTQAPIEYSV